MLAFELAPDKEVSGRSFVRTFRELNSRLRLDQVRKYIERAAEMEGIDL